MGGGGGVLGGLPMEGMLVKMDRGGVLTHGKRQAMCVLSILKFARAFVQANQSFHLIRLCNASPPGPLIRLCNASPPCPVGI